MQEKGREARPASFIMYVLGHVMLYYVIVWESPGRPARWEGHPPYILSCHQLKPRRNRRPHPGRRSAPGSSTAHKPRGQPPLARLRAGQGGAGPTEEGVGAGSGPVPGKFLGRVGQDPK